MHATNEQTTPKDKNRMHSGNRAKKKKTHKIRRSKRNRTHQLCKPVEPDSSTQPYFMRFLFGMLFRQALFFRRDTKKDVCATPPQGPAFYRGIVAHLHSCFHKKKRRRPQPLNLLASIFVCSHENPLIEIKAEKGGFNIFFTQRKMIAAE